VIYSRDLAEYSTAELNAYTEPLFSLQGPARPNSETYISMATNWEMTQKAIQEWDPQVTGAPPLPKPQLVYYYNNTSRFQQTQGNPEQLRAIQKQIDNIRNVGTEITASSAKLKEEFKKELSDVNNKLTETWTNSLAAERAESQKFQRLLLDSFLQILQQNTMQFGQIVEELGHQQQSTTVAFLLQNEIQDKSTERAFLLRDRSDSAKQQNLYAINNRIAVLDEDIKDAKAQQSRLLTAKTALPSTPQHSKWPIEMTEQPTPTPANRGKRGRNAPEKPGQKKFTDLSENVSEAYYSLPHHISRYLHPICPLFYEDDPSPTSGNENLPLLTATLDSESGVSQQPNLVQRAWSQDNRLKPSDNLAEVLTETSFKNSYSPSDRQWHFVFYLLLLLLQQPLFIFTLLINSTFTLFPLFHSIVCTAQCGQYSTSRSVLNGNEHLDTSLLHWIWWKVDFFRQKRSTTAWGVFLSIVNRRLIITLSHQLKPSCCPT